MGSHVALIRTPPVLPVSSITAQQGVPAIALAYLTAALKEAGHSVTPIDSLGEKLGQYSSFGIPGLLFAGLSAAEIVARVPIGAPWIGLSCNFSNDWIYARELIARLLAEFPATRLVLGGEHVSADYEKILRAFPAIYACAIGEGEETLVELVSSGESGIARAKIDGIAYFEGGKVIKNRARMRQKAPTRIHWPDWESLPIERYLDAGLGMAAQGERTMPMLASRGCPYRCTFCSAPQMWEARWYAREVDDVIAEARHYIHRYRVTHLEFYDMSASVNKRWFTELTDALGGLGVKWNFASGIRSEALDEPLLESITRNGCYKLTFPLETSSLRLIGLIKKKVDPNRAFPLIRVSVKKGLVTKVNFIWGLQGQTTGDILGDYWFLAKLAAIGLHDATCFAFVPYPGSEDFNRLRDEGRIPSGEEYDRFLAFNVYNNPFRMKSWSRHVPHWTLGPWCLGGMALFYGLQFVFRPHRFWLLVRRIAQGKPVTMLELALHGLVKNFVVGKKIHVADARPSRLEVAQRPVATSGKLLAGG